MPNASNVENLAKIHAQLSAGGGSFFLLDPQGMSSKEEYRLRKELKSNQAKLMVAKNTLIRIALGEQGLPEILGLTGSSAILTFADPVAAAKVVRDFRKDLGRDLPRLKSGILQGQVLGPDQIEAIADLPSLDQLRAELVGVLQGAASEFVGVLEAAAREMVGVLEAFIAKQD